VPGPDKYKTQIGEWSQLKQHGGKFNKEPKNMYTEQIIHMSKSKEKSSPGVGKYEVARQWKNSSTIDCNNFKTAYKTMDPRLTFPSGMIAEKAIVPAPNKYTSIDLDRIKTSTVHHTISKSHMPRFKKDERTLAPSPSSYMTEKSH
jgi:hypothetical protein